MNGTGSGVLLSNLTIRNGKSKDGAGLSLGGSKVVLDKISVVDNFADTDGQGGGLYSNSDS